MIGSTSQSPIFEKIYTLLHINTCFSEISASHYIGFEHLSQVAKKR